jgi:hypothetical protein
VIALHRSLATRSKTTVGADLIWQVNIMTTSYLTRLKDRAHAKGSVRVPDNWSYRPASWHSHRRNEVILLSLLLLRRRISEAAESESPQASESLPLESFGDACRDRGRMVSSWNEVKQDAHSFPMYSERPPPPLLNSQKSGVCPYTDEERRVRCFCTRFDLGVLSHARAEKSLRSFVILM